MAKKTSLIEEFLKKGNKVGSITPSSRFLVKKMLEPVVFSEDMCIAEFGTGTGNITRGLLAQMPPKSLLLAFEINPELYEQLGRELQDDRLRLINDSAEQLEKYLSENNREKADYIISSLPLAILDKETEESILDTVVRALSPGGAFIQFQYSPASLKKLKDRFSDIKTDFTPYNIPPALVYTCRNK
ncbi:MAG: phospholipid N-methyltransferase [Bacteroidetes bacterium]|nr:MAG: phospholipid N-methyltransferase [Bacteroidota bacterium]